MRIADLNTLDRTAFVAAIGHVYEDTPWVAERAWSSRRFASLDQLCDAMQAAVTNASREEQLALLGALAKCAPPLRNARERNELLRCALHGEIDIIGSDHSPCPPMMKDSHNVFAIWGGIAGVQSTLQVLLHLGFDPARIAATTAKNPARRFRLPRRGAIEVGNFADLTLVDPDANSAPALLHRHGVSPYAGSALQGVIKRTIRRGATIFADGVIVNHSKGQFVHA